MSTFEFQGEERFSTNRQTLWQFLSDLHNVPRYTPNLQNVQFPSDDKMTAKLTPGFSFAKGTFDLAIEVKERQTPHTAKMLVTARGMGCRAIIEGTARLSEDSTAPAATLLQWNATATLEGLMGLVSKGLIEGASKKILSDAFDAMRREMGLSPASTTA
jgi:carbon monoxide dehydrogenase subunit G